MQKYENMQYSINHDCEVWWWSKTKDFGHVTQDGWLAGWLDGWLAGWLVDSGRWPWLLVAAGWWLVAAGWLRTGWLRAWLAC